MFRFSFKGGVKEGSSTIKFILFGVIGGRDIPRIQLQKDCLMFSDTSELTAAELTLINAYQDNFNLSNFMARNKYASVHPYLKVFSYVAGPKRYPLRKTFVVKLLGDETGNSLLVRPFEGNTDFFFAAENCKMLSLEEIRNLYQDNKQALQWFSTEKTIPKNIYDGCVIEKRKAVPRVAGVKLRKLKGMNRHEHVRDSKD